MSKSGQSLFYFGIYSLLAGLGFLLIPATLISLLKLPEIPLSWARIIGMLVIIIGCYDMISGRTNSRPQINASIYLRSFFAAGVLVLVLSGQMAKEILPLGIIDAIGAIWTFFALRSETK